MKQKHHVAVLKNGRVFTLGECTVRQAAQYCKASDAKLLASFDDETTAWAYRCGFHRASNHTK